MTEKLPFSSIYQIGVIVRDLDKAIKYYESLGIGPFEPLNIKITERKILGKPIDPTSLKIRYKAAQMGPVQLELIEAGEGAYHWREFLDKGGEGINHLAFLVDDIDKEQSRLEAMGFRTLYSARFEGGGGSAYFDTGRVGGVLSELLQWQNSERIKDTLYNRFIKEQTMTERLPFGSVYQVGVIVRDLDKAIKYYESLGIGPFEPLNIKITERKILGKPIDPASLKITYRVAQMGPVQLELIEAGEGAYHWREFLDKRGEGINHLAFLVDDIDKEQSRLEAMGFRTLYSARFEGGGGSAWFDTGRVGGILFEIEQFPTSDLGLKPK